MISDHPYQQGLPSGLLVEVSTDDQTWTTLQNTTNRFPCAYTLQNRVYVNGFMGRMQVAVGAQARYLRLTFSSAYPAADRWRIEELIVLEKSGPSLLAGQDEPSRIRKELEQHGNPFLATDRWLSARLLAGGYRQVYPRFNSKILETVRQRDKPLGPGVAVAVPSGWSEWTLAVLRRNWPHPGGDVVAKVVNTGAYTLIFTRSVSDAGPASGLTPLFWNDHLLMKGPPPPWR
jgi:hypothetical protein